MKSLTEYIKESSKTARPSLDEVYKCFKDGDYTSCYEAMKAIFEKSSKTPYSKVLQDKENKNAFISYKKIAPGVECCELFLLDGDTWISIWCDNTKHKKGEGEIVIRKYSSRSGYFKSTMKCALVEFSQEMLDLMNEKYE